VWVDTGAQDEYRDAQKSVANEFEVALCKDITSIIRKRVRKAKLAVIAMYSSQVNRLVSALKGIVTPDDIESVDAFEGRESDAVILSLVRSNERAAIGFLNDPNRVNVAISRAKKLLVIGGAPELFGPLFLHAEQEGLVAGVGAVVTACQRVGIRSQVQRLSRPKRGSRRHGRRRRRGGQGQPEDQPATAEPGTETLEAAEVQEPLERPSRRRRRRRGGGQPPETTEAAAVEAAPGAPDGEAGEPAKVSAVEGAAVTPAESPAPAGGEAGEVKPRRSRSRRTSPDGSSAVEGAAVTRAE